ncbi:MAG: hypothetical protein U0075_13560 [Thermomicrobiales bacterium]
MPRDGIGQLRDDLPPELGQDAADVVLSRAHADVELGGDLAFVLRTRRSASTSRSRGVRNVVFASDLADITTQ